MNSNLINQLKKITAEEKKILTGIKGIDRTIYNTNNSSVIDAKVLLEQGKLIDIRPHTRFVHFPKHTHNYIEMVYMISGRTRHFVNGNEVILREGELLLMNQHAVQEIYPAREEDIAVNFMILPEFFDTTLLMTVSEDSKVKDFLINSLRSTSGHVDYLHFQVSDVLPVQNLIENMIYILLSHPENQNQLNQNTAGLLFLHLMQYTDHLTIGGKDYEDMIMVKVLTLIEENYKDGRLSDLCESTDTDLYSISRIIKRKTGRTYTDLLQEKRLKHACFLLSNSTLPITDICASVGYNNFSYFYKLFKKVYQMTPKEYRAQSHSNKSLNHSSGKNAVIQPQ